MKTMQVSELKSLETNQPVAQAAANHHVRFTRLRCNVAEDGDEDECYLRVRFRADNQFREHTFERKMRPGQVWDMPQTSFPLSQGDCIAWLYDEDGPFDGDDYLGGVYISSLLPLGGYFADCTLDEANYRLELVIE